MARDDGRQQCPHCDRSFGKLQGMIDHARIVHGVTITVTPERPEGTNRRPSLGEILPQCIECGAIAKLTTGEVVYPHRRDLYDNRMYLCSCGAYVGCHPGSFVPLGYPCGEATRRARMAAHNAFDPLWKPAGSPMNRHQAYKWLAEEMQIPREQCHIGMMTGDQARKAFNIASAYRHANSERGWLRV